MARTRYCFQHEGPIAYTLPRSQQILFWLRIVEIVVAVVYVALLLYSAVHHGWWHNLGQPIGFGITAFILTIAVSVPTFVGYTSSNATATRQQFVNYSARVVFELVVVALWSAAFVTMLLPKGKDFKLLFERPPYAEWDIAVVLSVLEIILFLYTMAIVYQEKYLTDPRPFSATGQLNGIPRR